MKSSKSSLFLIELIISILFFSIASAACIQLFVKAHLTDEKTQETNQIVIWSQNLSELWYANEGSLPAVYNRLSADYSTENICMQLTESNNKLTIYMNQDFSFCDPADYTATYRIELCNEAESESGLLQLASICFFKDTDEASTLLYNLSLQQYTAVERGALHE